MSVAFRPWSDVSGDSLALADERIELNWAEVNEIVTRAANGLLGFRAGGAETVAVCAENSAEWILATLAGICAGASVVPISFHLRPGEVRYILEDSGAEVVFTGPETLGIVTDAIADLPHVMVVCWGLDRGTGPVPADRPVVAWEKWLDEQAPAEPAQHIRPRAPLLYTSGTTGRPKGVKAPLTVFPGGDSLTEYVAMVRSRSLPGLRREGQDAARALPPAGLIITPLHHLSGMTLVPELICGRPLVVLGRFDAEKTLGAIERYRIGSVFMVPTHFVRLLALPEEARRKYDLSSLRAVSHGAAACPVELKLRMIDWLGPILFESYGATESGGVCRISSPEWLEHMGSVGRPADYDVLVVGEDGQCVAVGEIGILYFRHHRGYEIAYRNDPEKTAAAHLSPGIFTLGDVGYVDGEGYVYVTDRIADVVISGGVNIYPAEIEQVLSAHPAVAAVAVIGVPNEEFGEEVKALVVPVDDGARPAREELVALCRESLAGYKCPRSVEFIDAIPRSDVGKVDKRELRERYGDAGPVAGDVRD